MVHNPNYTYREFEEYPKLLCVEETLPSGQVVGHYATIGEVWEWPRPAPYVPVDMGEKWINDPDYARKINMDDGYAKYMEKLGYHT